MFNLEGVTTEEFLEYKGRPLVRHDGDIYYGDLSAKYHIHMIIMSEKEIKGTARGQKISSARHMAVYLAREITEKSFVSIAEFFNKKHTTIMFAYEKIQCKNNCQP